MYCSLGAYERFKALTLIILWFLLLQNDKLHNEKAKALALSSEPTTAPTGMVHVLTPWLHTIRMIAFSVLVYSYCYESLAACQRIRLVE